MNGELFIEEILAAASQNEQDAQGNEQWPDSVHHQSWHDSWRNSH